SVGILASHEQSYGFDAYFFALLNVHGLSFETASLDPALVHPQQHIGPITRFGAARARVNREKCIRTIVFTENNLANPKFIQFMNEAFMFCLAFFFCLGGSR